PERLRISPEDWAKIRGPLAMLLGLTGLGFPLRAYSALVAGLQDAKFGGLLALCQSALTVGLTATLIPLGFRLHGLAIATGVPPLLGGLAAVIRVSTRFSETTHGWRNPAWTGCRHLLGQGFGAWLGGLGVRLMSASNGLVLGALGRPDLATVYAGTGKVAQV